MPILPEELNALASLVAAGGLTVLTGAGISTESGIPDYRGPTGLARNATPMTYETFVGSHTAQQRYWARSHVGWRQIGLARPNSGHASVAALQHAGFVDIVITQNVDGLHQAAGATDVIDLHGRLDQVICLDCRATSGRGRLDMRLRELNADWETSAIAWKPDGDAVIDETAISAFEIAGCECCGGRLKPDVVFFGENVPRPRVERCFAAVDAAQSLVVLGSSLTVASGYRFVRHAAKLGKPIAIVNQGATRGDVLADLILDAPLGTTLCALADAVSASVGTVTPWINASAS